MLVTVGGYRLAFMPRCWRTGCREQANRAKHWNSVGSARSTPDHAMDAPYRNGRVLCRNGRLSDFCRSFRSIEQRRSVPSSVVSGGRASFGTPSGSPPCTSSNTMTTRKALSIAMILVAGATASILLAPPKSRPTHTTRTIKLKEGEDPFADMIEEGDGFLAQRKAEEAEAARKQGAA